VSSVVASLKYRKKGKKKKEETWACRNTAQTPSSFTRKGNGAGSAETKKKKKGRKIRDTPARITSPQKGNLPIRHVQRKGKEKGGGEANTFPWSISLFKGDEPVQKKKEKKKEGKQHPSYILFSVTG